MKRKDILKKLAEAGMIFKEGANHTKILDQNGKVLTVVGRHNEIAEEVVAAIEKQSGVKLR